METLTDGIKQFYICDKFVLPDLMRDAVCQDPVYGKGKLAEIQGLILGMLDTFNYEQVCDLANETGVLMLQAIGWSHFNTYSFTNGIILVSYTRILFIIFL